MNIITKKMKQATRGEIVTLNRLVENNHIILDDQIKNLFHELLKNDITLRRFVTVMDIPHPTRDQLIEYIKGGDVFLLLKHRHLYKYLTIDEIKDVLKSHTTAKDIKWVPQNLRENKEFRKWIYTLNRPPLTRNFIRYMDLNELQKALKGDSKANILYSFPYDELKNKHIFTLVQNPDNKYAIQNIIAVRVGNNGEIKHIRQDKTRTRIKIEETILDIKISLSTYTTKIVAKLKELE